MPDNHYFGCCACNGSLGAGLIPKIAFFKSEDGFVFNLFISGEIKIQTDSKNNVIFKTKTDYPKSGNISIKLTMEKNEEFDILLRNPHWSSCTSVSVNNEKLNINNGYIKIHRNWKTDDVIDIHFDMRTEIIKPIPYGHDILMNKVIWGQNYVIPTYDIEDIAAKNHISLRRGPITLAMDNRLGKSVDEPISIDNHDKYIDVEVIDEKAAPYKCILEVAITDKNKQKIYLTDYASAGKLWNEESKMAAWLLINEPM